MHFVAQRISAPKQLSLGLKKRPTWGGKRKGAGRPPRGARAGVTHGTRPEVDVRYVVHVTLRVKQHVWNLRSKRCYSRIKQAFRGVRARDDFRLVHYTVQGNHLHLICEADTRRALSSGIASLSIRMARALNHLMGKAGKVFADRYHARVLKSPRELAGALAYVLENAAKHGIQRAGLDRFCSWAERREQSVADTRQLLSRPTSWLLRVGWRRARDDGSALERLERAMSV